MATVERKSNGYYLAKWVAGDGSRQSLMTSHRDFEGALKEANKTEARAKFWEAANDGIFTFMAELGFSPDYCHANFSHKGHIPAAEFRKLLREASINFKKPSHWRDKKPKSVNKKKYRFRGRIVSLDEALDMANSPITVATVRGRINNGWSVEDAVTKPLQNQKCP